MSRLSKRGRIAAFSVLLVVIGFGGGHFATEAFATRYELGVDMQNTTCLPWRVYLVDRDTEGRVPRRGDIVRFFSEGLEPHFKDGWSVSKLVAAVAGDRVEIRGDVVSVNGVLWDRLWLNGYLKAEPGAFDRAFTVAEGEVLLLATAPGSYDGRYWGTLPVSRVDGYVTPLL